MLVLVIANPREIIRNSDIEHPTPQVADQLYRGKKKLLQEDKMTGMAGYFVESVRKKARVDFHLQLLLCISKHPLPILYNYVIFIDPRKKSCWREK